MYPGCAHHLRRFSTVIQRLPTGVVDPGLSGRRAVGVPSANRHPRRRPPPRRHRRHGKLSVADDTVVIRVGDDELVTVGGDLRRTGTVSVAEFRGSQGPEERNPEMGFDRTPPQDLAAEQCVLGAMMLSKDAIADVIETLRGTDFHPPAHEIVFDAVTDLYARGEPADAITVAAELNKRGEMARIGGAPYVHTLVASVP